MEIQDFFQKRATIYTGLGLARMIPLSLGYRLADKVGNRIADQQPGIYRQLKENLSHIPDANSSPEMLNRIARQNVIHMSRYYFEFYHLIGRRLETLQKQVNTPPAFLELVESTLRSGKGVQLAGLHLGNFDLVMLVLAARFQNVQALSAAAPNEGYQAQNELRARYGLEITPINTASLRKAIMKLKSGGVVATGLDWPNPEETDLTEVFGKPAHIPLGPARLALLSDAVTIILATYTDSNGIHRLLYSKPIQVVRTGDKRNDIIQNTRAYIRVFEEFVSRYPEQWIMHHPFWAAKNQDPPEVRKEEF